MIICTLPECQTLAGCQRAPCRPVCGARAEAALPSIDRKEEGSVSVKAREWVEQISGEWWIADRYRIEKFDGGGFAARSKGPQSGALVTLCFGVSFEAAKAAAQSDYETRILSALAAIEREGGE